MPAPDGGGHAARVGGAAAFVFAAALALTASGVLAVVGAPLPVVGAAAPAGAWLAILALGLFLGARTLPSFLATGARASVLVAGLAFAFALGDAGFALGLPSDFGLAAPWLVGGAALAFLVGPRARLGGAFSDILATRFPAWPLRGAFALANVAVGGLTAMAGVRVGQAALTQALGGSAQFADVLIGVTLAASIAAGGALALTWIDAACGALLFALAAALAAWSQAAGTIGMTALAPLPADWWNVGGGGATSGIALAAALAGFAPIAAALGAAGSTARAAKVGALGFVAGAAALLAFAIAAPQLAPEGAGTGAARNALALLLGLGLARQGVFAAIRAIGYDLARAPRLTANLASLRLARLRVAAVGVSLAGVAGASDFPQPAAAFLSAALALSLALTTPCLLLAFSTRAGALSALAALLAGAGNFLRLGRLPTSLADLSLPLAAQGALLATLAGAAVALILPRQAGQPAVETDAFLD